MARIVADSLELQDIANGRWATIAVGGLDAVPVVRGTDWEIPGKAGREGGARVVDTLPITISMFLTGSGSTHDAVRDSYHTRMTALKAIFNPARSGVDTVDLVLHPDAEGVGGRVPTGQTATIHVQTLRFVGPPAVGGEARLFEIECVAIDSPPVWVLA